MSMKQLVQAVAFSALSGTASATVVELALLNQCAERSDGQARLDCYDKVVSDARGSSVSQPTPLLKPNQMEAPAPPKAGGTGKWKRAIETSPIDDSKTVTLTLAANSQIKTRLGSEQPLLVARCMEGATDAYIAWGTFITTGEIALTIRFDKEPARLLDTSMSTDHTATFIGPASQLNQLEFLKKAANHTTLLVQVTPYGESPVMTTFDLTGLATVLPELRAACKW